ncbi:hypothetical protein DHD32_12785 [Arenibacter sp. TNZ]|uniref:HdeD family acid-resistance protein n=1 Tax=Arenibacter TaxID=178469 RepID=UPI000CD41949|nr:MULTISPECIES: DUF308 domain-containing protein [Arenibacter]MCM4172363.1 hypothetical protein [Arenibacter sp. TNZ]
MKDLVYSTVMPVAKKWWINLLMGLLFVSLGLWVFITPLASYVSLTIFFSLALATAGAFEIFASIFYREGIKNWGWYLIGGVFDLLIGGYLLLNPLTTMAVLPYILAFWMLYKGVLAIGISVKLNSWNCPSWVLTLAYGIAIMVFSLLIMIYPILGGTIIVYATALAFLTLGMFNISSAYHFYRMGNRKFKLQIH